MSFAGFLGDVLKGAVSSDNLRDYQHASRTFRSGNYALFPKFKNQWHIYFEMNMGPINTIKDARQAMEAFSTTSLRSGSESFSAGASPSNARLSLLCKSVKLPSYKFDVKKYNQYNKTLLTVNKINYDPITIEFHDDSLNVMRNFWDAYYTYHIQDSRYRRYTSISNQGMGIPKELTQDIKDFSSIYNYDAAKHWGLDTVTLPGQTLDKIEPFFTFIKIYHFSRPVDARGSDEDNVPHYSEYTLINPIITSFDHDNLDYSSTETSKNSMTIEYETVFYSQGILDENFSEVSSLKSTDIYRDKAKSPLSQPQANLFGTSGLASTLGGLRGQNPLQAALTIGKTVNSWKNAGGIAGLVNSASQEAKTVLNQSMTQIQQNSQTGTQKITVPTLSSQTLSSKLVSAIKPPKR